MVPNFTPVRQKLNDIRAVLPAIAVHTQRTETQDISYTTWRRA